MTNYAPVIATLQGQMRILERENTKRKQLQAVHERRIADLEQDVAALLEAVEEERARAPARVANTVPTPKLEGGYEVKRVFGGYQLYGPDGSPRGEKGSVSDCNALHASLLSGS